MKRRLAVAAVGCAAAVSLGWLPAAEADPQPRAERSPQPTSLARKAGVEPGNAPMGWYQDAVAAQTPAARSRLASNAKAITGVLGIDVSSHQGNVNWPRYRAQGKLFAYVKATEGTTYRNPYFKQQFNGSYYAGMVRGAYHFANPAGASGTTQANYFANHGGTWWTNRRIMPGVLDIEYNPYGSRCYGISKAKMVAWISAFVVQYKKRTGRDAVIYTTADWWKSCTGNTTKFRYTNPLWVARYGTSTPGTLPGGWPYYTFWQYSSSPVDQNRFSSTYARLMVLANGK